MTRGGGGGFSPAGKNKPWSHSPSGHPAQRPDHGGSHTPPPPPPKSCLSVGMFQLRGCQTTCPLSHSGQTDPAGRCCPCSCQGNAFWQTCFSPTSSFPPPHNAHSGQIWARPKPGVPWAPRERGLVSPWHCIRDIERADPTLQEMCSLSKCPRGHRPVFPKEKQMENKTLIFRKTPLKRVVGKNSSPGQKTACEFSVCNPQIGDAAIHVAPWFWGI